MRESWPHATLLGLALLTAGGPVTAAAQSSGELSRGLDLARKHCAACHAVTRRGASPHRDAPAFRTLGNRYPVDTLQEALAEGLMTGHPDMPEFRFGPRDVAAFIAYLNSIQAK